jgi:pyrimidine-nucleoside phosphorylase
MESALETSGIGYTLNTSDLAPADLFLFNLRKNKNAKELPDLVIASLLSKKICSGVNNVIVDVRMGPTGNFGYTLADVERNSRKMVSAGQSLGIKCICILTNNNYSAIPHYGRLESLSVAWDLANKKPLDAWTNEHIETCIKIAAYGICAFKHIGFKEAIQFIEESIKNGSMLNKLELNLRSQGSSVESIRKLMGEYEFEKKYPIISLSNGYVKSININKIRDIFLEVYKNNYDQKRFNSPIGFSFHLREGMRVREGDVLMEVRTPPEGIDNYICKINSIVNIQDEPFYACLNERICGVIKYE